MTEIRREFTSGRMALTGKGQKETSWNDGNSLYLDLVGYSISTQISKKLSSIHLRFYVNYTSIQKSQQHNDEMFLKD